MKTAVNVVMLLAAAAILVAEMNVIKNTTYVSTKEALVGFGFSVIVVGCALGLLSLVEW